MNRHFPLSVAARIWGALPNERLKTAVLARLGPRFLVSVWAIIFDGAGGVLLFRHTHGNYSPTPSDHRSEW